MGARILCFVQFPHPGGEHHPPTDNMPWNVDDHGRTFLLSPGRYLDSDGHLVSAEVTLWGEWEPPSRIIRRWPARDRQPRALHRPYWTRSAVAGFRQNTDPWIWGAHMLYSDCKQIVGPHRRPTSMQDLAVGSVICFGSTIDGQFCLDTVFVVSSFEPWIPAEGAKLTTSEAFKTCTAAAIVAGTTDAHTDLTLYRAATITRPVNGMYSFVPAMPGSDPGHRFRRPPIRLPGLINPASRQSTWGSKRPLSAPEVKNAWESVRNQVLGSGLHLAVTLNLPHRQRDHAPTPTTQRQRC